MEKNIVMGLPDSSGESDSSDWAVIDEDTSLEWNDEAKYHFRHAKRKSILGQSVEEVSLPVNSESGEVGGEVSDDDSIEVVSDDANDDHMSTKNHWVRPTKTDLQNNEVVKNEVLNNETSEPQDSEVYTDMIWYPVRENNELRNDEKSLSIYETHMKRTSSTTVTSRLLTSCALLAIIFAVGLSLGYICRSLGTIQMNTGPDGSDSTLNYHIVVHKLHHENKLLRWKLRNIHSRLDSLPSTTFSLNNTEGAFSRNESRRKLPVATPKFKTSHNSIFSSTNHFMYNQHKMKACSINHSEKIEYQNTFATKCDTNNKDDESEVESIILENVIFEDMCGNEHDKVVKNNKEANIHLTLTSTTEKIDSLLTSHGRFQIDTKRALLLSIELMKKMDINLEILDSLSGENLTSRFKSKLVQFVFSINKIKRKIAKKIDKSFHKLALDIQRKVEESKSAMLEKLCYVNNILDKENITLFDWSNESMISECNTKKNTSDITGHRLKKAYSVLQSNKTVKKFLKSGEKLRPTNSDGKQLETKKLNRKKTGTKQEPELVKKVCRPNAKDCKGKENTKRLLEIGTHSNIDIVEDNSDSIKRNEIKRNVDLHDKNLQNSADKEKFKNSKEWLDTEHKISNVSGEWVMKMGKGREEQRNYEHQSDWLFDRAESRKIYRDKDNRPIKKGSSQQYEQHYESNTEPKVTFKEQAVEYWKNKKQLLKKMIPKTIVGAAESMKNAFKNLQGKKKMRARQQ